MASVSTDMPRVELARAKVNLTLHVTGRRSDGYHLLDSLVAFPQIGDRISLQAAPRLELRVDGPFARDLEGPDGDNLILKAVSAFSGAIGQDALPGLCITLTKRLPVASGIGGGSSDAATTLRLLEDFTGTYLPDDDLNDLALSLGADVPVCLVPEPQIMRGIGEKLSPGPELPACGIVLINPKVSVSTPEVFKSLSTVDNAPMPLAPEGFDTISQLAAYLESCRNDLQDAATGLQPLIGEVLASLASDRRIEFARMSGSGATCFGLCALEDAMDIERSLREAHPQWWISSGPLS